MIEKIVVILTVGLSVGVDWICKDLELEPKNINKKIAILLTIITAVLPMINAFGVSIVFWILNLIQKQWKFICIYIFVFAVLAPLMAVWDRRNYPDEVSRKYIFDNFIWNLIGAACPCFLLNLVHQEIGDFHFIDLYPMDEIVNMLIPVCFWLALAYQSREQRNTELDHSASLVRINQRCNLLHLFHTYFWSLVSAVFIVVYIMYSCIHDLPIYWSNKYIVLIILVLGFFYRCGLHKYNYLYLVFVICIPMILISSIYWMSLFPKNNTMMFIQLGFTIVNMFIYTFIILKRNGIIVLNRTDWIKVESWFPIVLFFLVMLAYAMLMVALMPGETVSYNYAQSRLIAICEGTDKEPGELFDQIMQENQQTKVKGSIDRVRYLKFVYDNLFSEMLKKNIIEEADASLSFEQLENWYDNLPPGNFAYQ